MGRYRPVLVAALLAAWGVALAAETTPTMVWVGTAPAGACVGNRVVALATTGAMYCCSGGTWATCGGSGGGAPTNAPYVVTAPVGGLSAEVVLPTCSGTDKLTFNGATISCQPDAGGSAPPSTTALLAGNGAGGFATYAGSACTGSNLVQSLSTTGAATCWQLRLSQLANPVGDTAFTYPTGTKMLWTFTGSTDEAFTIHGDGAFTGTGDLVHIHKSGTGATAGADALHVEVDTDTNMTGIRVTMANATRDAITTNAKVMASGGFVGALTGNASTATALAADGADCVGAGEFSKGVNASGVASGCAVPAGTYSLPDATNLVTGGVRLAGQLGGTATSPTVTGVTGAIVGVSNINATGTPSSSTFLRGDGSWQAASGSGLAGTLLKVATSDVTNSTTTPANIFTYSVPAAGEYGFTCVINAQGTTTSLPRYNVNGPSATNVSFQTERATTTSAQTLLTLQAFSAAAQTAACTTSCNATNLITRITGSFTASASGTLAFMVTSSTAAQAVVVRRGSYCLVF